jgi:hypothetical protein
MFCGEYRSQAIGKGALLKFTVADNDRSLWGGSDFRARFTLAARA